MEVEIYSHDDNKSLISDQENAISKLFEITLKNVRSDMESNPYLNEALKVLSVQGYRSSIGCIWNAVVDDLRNKILHRSASLFSKYAKIQIERYDDFQTKNINDDQLIEGAYQIGVISWEASKVLKHAKETRHIFDGHPKSSAPSIMKVASMLEDFVKYVLSVEYPVQVIDIDDYIETMNSSNFDKNDIATHNALSSMPDIYKNELINRLFTDYIDSRSSSILRSNIEFIAPILWITLANSVKFQISRRVDQIFPQGDQTRTSYAFKFIFLVKGNSFLSETSRLYILTPIIDKLKNNLDNWSIENECVLELRNYADNIPNSLLNDYVSSITQTYVGNMGHSFQFTRTDFYADTAAYYIPTLFESFDDNAASVFINVIRNNKILKSRIENPTKLNRLRSLSNIVNSKIADSNPDKNVLEALIDPSREEEFFKLIGKK